MMTTTNTTRLDRVMLSQRRLMVFNVAATLSVMMSVGASIVAMF